jgi:hypothetical protein
MAKYNLVSSIEELKKLSLNENTEFFILLSGILRSSKTVRYFLETDKFNVLNEIDNTFQKNLSENDLRLKTNIVEAIEKKSFFKY